MLRAWKLEPSLQMNPEHPQVQPIDVVAAIIVREGCVLISKRGQERNNAGLWEFPGGRVESGEDHRQALRRELKECFNIDCEIGSYVTTSRHRYTDRVVALHAYEVDQETPLGWFPRAEHVAVAWVHQSELLEFKFAPADQIIAERLGANSDAGTEQHFFEVEKSDTEPPTEGS